MSDMGQFEDVFPPENIAHHFTGQDQAKGVYAKELRIPAGFTLVSHRHTYDHLSILAVGHVRMTSGASVKYLFGPCALTIPAGAPHTLHAITNAVWFCIHPTDETDENAVDETLIEKEPV